ncbi:hypothetical protein MSM1_13195 [Mycobacterium sp. SM1]|uniref:hypothetical protein n=1 Tax=Mycobacterium sp. SM1 TaxID=2816243 RepID=UPI001BCF94FE|nr:hypothetical protein [Mycobacterium sp. SM1]MBS4729251.1 hypothetical protein [Mycobacterium sp. SM1]
MSAATLYNWRRAYGGMDLEAVTKLKELRGQNTRLKQPLTKAELEKDALREVAKGKVSARPPSGAPGLAQSGAGPVGAAGVQSGRVCPLHLPAHPCYADPG